mgnify:CR=1 FL=1
MSDKDIKEIVKLIESQEGYHEPTSIQIANSLDYFKDRISILNYTSDSVGYSGKIAFVVYGAVDFISIFQQNIEGKWYLKHDIAEGVYEEKG